MGAGTLYYGLDGMKFILSLFIVTIHTGPFLDISYDLNYLVTQGLGRIGVPFFFAASGFLLYRKIPAGRIDTVRIKRYLWNILRLYLVWTAIYLPVIFVTGFLHNPKGILHATLSFLRTMVMSGSYLQLWFLQALLVAAVMITWILWRRWSWRKIFFVTGALHLILLIGLGGYYPYFREIFPDGGIMWSFWHGLKYIFVTPRNGICFGALYFAIGVYCAQREKHLSLKYIRSRLGTFGALYMLEVFGGSFLGINGKAETYIFLIPVTYYLFLYAKTMRLPDSPWWLYLRKQSMFIFYIHPWFVFLTSHLLGAGKYSVIDIGTFPRFLIVIFCSILFGHLVIKLQETRFARYVQYLS